MTSGLRFIRNPLYTSFILITIGAAPAFDTSSPLVALIPAVVIIGPWAIKPEERYLAETFGREYAAYSAKVQR